MDLLIENGQGPEPEREDRIGGGDAGTAGANLHGRRHVGIGQAAAKAFAKAPPVGVVAIAPAIFQHDRVDRAEIAGLIRQFVEERDDQLLAGMCDVQAGEAVELGLPQQLRQIRGRGAALTEIDQFIFIGQALCRAFLHVHRRRKGGLDAGADQSGLQRFEECVGHRRRSINRRVAGLPQAKAGSRIIVRVQRPVA